MGMLLRRKLVTTAVLIATLAGHAFAFDGAPQIGKWGFDLSGMDREAKPGDSFFDYASGAWDARSVIPPDKSFFGAFDTLRDRSQEQVRAIIEDAARSGAATNTDAGKIGALYHAFMDEARLDELDAAPIAGDLARIRSAQSKLGIAVLMGRARGGFGASFFALGVDEDHKDPTRNTLYASQAG